MKKKIISILILASLYINAQVPQGINYQAVVRNNVGTILTNTIVGFQFKIYNSQTATTSNSPTYVETHANVPTGSAGVATCTIGAGAINIGTFSSINWSGGDVWYQTSIILNSTTYTLGLAQKFQTVPYAFYAGKASSTFSVSGNTLYSVGGSTVTLPIITSTTSVITPTIIGQGLAFVNPTTANNFTVSVPSPTLNYTTGSNTLSISSGTTISNIITLSSGVSITPTITGQGIAVVSPTTGNTFTVSVPSPSLTYDSFSDVLTLIQGSSTTSLSLASLGTNTATTTMINILGTGLANVSPSSGTTFTVDVPPPVLSINNGTLLSIQQGTYSSSSVTLPSSLWTQTGSYLYPSNTVSVGIGTSTPNNFFQVKDYFKMENNGFNIEIGQGAKTGTTSSTGNYYNTSVGYLAGNATTNNANANTFIGYASGYNNTTGHGNSFLGVRSGTTITDGYNNTFIGSDADGIGSNIFNATAIGNNAKVGASNAMVLGDGNINVGIGINNPLHKLHVNKYNNIDAAAIFASNADTGPDCHGVKAFASGNDQQSAALWGQNTGAGPSLFAKKTSGLTGNAGRFILSPPSTAFNTEAAVYVEKNGFLDVPAIYAITNGSGAAVYAKSTNQNSPLALELNDGHIKSSQNSFLNFTGTATLFATSPNPVVGYLPTVTTGSTSTDTKGSIKLLSTQTLTYSTSGIAYSRYGVTIPFTKSYSTIPTIIISPTENTSGGGGNIYPAIIEYYAQATLNNFTLFITFKVFPTGTTSFQISNLGFDYFVIE